MCLTNYLPLFITFLLLHCNAIEFPLSLQSEHVRNSARKQLTQLIPKNGPIPRNMDLVPFVDCLVDTINRTNPSVNDVLQQLESFTRSEYVDKMEDCIQFPVHNLSPFDLIKDQPNQLIRPNRPNRPKKRPQKEVGDGRIEMFFIRTRYVLWAWLRQLSKQENNQAKPLNRPKARKRPQNKPKS